MPNTRQHNARFLQTELEMAQTHLQLAAASGSLQEWSQHRATAQQGCDRVLRHLPDILLDPRDRRVLQRQATALQVSLQAAGERATLRAYLTMVTHAGARAAGMALRCRTALHKAWRPLLVGLSGAALLYRVKSHSKPAEPRQEAVLDAPAVSKQAD